MMPRHPFPFNLTGGFLRYKYFAISLLLLHFAGSRLKINTLVIIIVVVVGGILWGAVGMILFIPFTSIIKLIADCTPSLKTLSLLLGDGEEKRRKHNNNLF